ncbi:MAG: hypothetical protein ACF8R7_17460 [Phycisphaerales bacterium JB039]
MQTTICTAVVAGLGVTASAQLVNPGIEDVTSPLFGAIDGWGPNGGWADHAGFARPGAAGLGNNFGFYSAGATETVGQVSSLTFQEGFEYTFASFAYPGGSDVGTIPYQIGYEDDLGAFVELATMAYDISGAGMWQELPGVSYTAASGGAEIGRPVWVRLGDASAGGNDDIWFDSFTLTAIPSPGAAVVLAIGPLAAVRRRR